MGTLRAIHEDAHVKPSVVQNRFYPRTAYDTELRAFCKDEGIIYESFWTLTGNPSLLASEPIRKLSQDAGVAKEIALYALVINLGIAPLNGTASAEHMKRDLEDVAKVRNWTFVYGEKWNGIVSNFKNLIGDES